LVGVSVMIAGSYSAPLYYGFMCKENWRYIWLGLVWSFNTLAAILITLTDTSGKVKAVTFVLAAFSGLPPLIHLNYNMDEKDSFKF
jgi:predicted membrane channel-forming protein YqfA (hemolysin III family)